MAGILETYSYQGSQPPTHQERLHHSRTAGSRLCQEGLTLAWWWGGLLGHGWGQGVVGMARGFGTLVLWIFVIWCLRLFRLLSQVPQTVGLEQRTPVSHCLGAGSPRSRCWQIGCLPRALFLVGRCCLLGKRVLGSLYPFIRSWTPFPRAPDSLITPKVPNFKHHHIGD